MRARFGVFTLLFTLLLIGSFALDNSAFAQGSAPNGMQRGAMQPPGMHPKMDSNREAMMRRIMLGEDLTPLKNYHDSVAFNKAFNEYYPTVAPKESLTKRLTEQFNRMYPAFKNRGVDSVEAWNAVMKTADITHDRTMYFRAFRQMFTAEDMKEYARFMKTSAGKKIAANQMTIGRVTGQTSNYPLMIVSRAISSLDKSAPTGGPRRRPGLGLGAPGMVTPNTRITSTPRAADSTITRTPR